MDARDASSPGASYAVSGLSHQPPAVSYEALAPVLEFVGPAPAVTYAAPAPVVEFIDPTPAVSCAAPAPMVEFVDPHGALPLAATKKRRRGNVAPKKDDTHATSVSLAAAYP